MAEKNIYIFAGERYMVTQSLKGLKASLDIQNEVLNVTVYKETPRAEELIAACAAVPFLAEKRMVAVRDCGALNAKGGAEDAKKIAAYLERMPDTTVLALCSDGMPDKRRALYKRIREIGVVKEFTAPWPAECAAFAIQCAQRDGKRMSSRTAELLVETAGCDYQTLENEVDKLAAYCEAQEISADDVAQCVSRSLEYNVFALHGLLMSGQAQKARRLLEDVLAVERPEALVGLFAKKVRDMYKTRAMLDAGFSKARIAAQLGVKEYAAGMLARDCKRFSQLQLRQGLVALAELDFGIKSGAKDTLLALPETLVRMYSL